MYRPLSLLFFNLYNTPEILHYAPPTYLYIRRIHTLAAHELPL